MSLDPTRVQLRLFSSGTGTATSTWATTPVPGNLLLAHVRDAGGTVVANGASIPGWTIANQEVSGTGAYTFLLYKIAGASEPGSVTVTVVNGSITNMTLEEWTNIDTSSSPLDKIASSPHTGVAVNSRTSGTTPTTTYPKELLLATFSLGNFITSGSQGFTNGFVEEVNAGDNFFSTFRIVTQVGAYESTMTWATSRVAAGMITTFKAVQSDPVKVTLGPIGTPGAGPWNLVVRHKKQ